MNRERQAESLVKEIEQRLGRQLQMPLRNAFLQVPRHLFINHYYRQQGNRLAWDRIEPPALEDMYRDQALVTKIDGRGLPISSSSQPSVMARQLELLDLRSGLRVLEIGTGTGYNAALMGRIIAPAGQVISIDIDPELLATAIRHLNAADISNVLVTKGDGFLGNPEHAPYDRILATCAVRSISWPWIEQLAPGGILLVNLRLNLSSVFLCLKKLAPARLEGNIFDLDAAYMEMHRAGDVPQSLRVDWSLYDSQPRHTVQLLANLAELLMHPAYSLLLECLLPSLRKKYRAFPETDEVHTYLIDASVPGSAILVQGDRAIVIDDQGYLEERLLQSLEWYERLELRMEDYRVSLDEAGVTLSAGEISFALES